MFHVKKNINRLVVFILDIISKRHNIPTYVFVGYENGKPGKLIIYEVYYDKKVNRWNIVVIINYDLFFNV